MLSTRGSHFFFQKLKPAISLFVEGLCEQPPAQVEISEGRRAFEDFETC